MLLVDCKGLGLGWVVEVGVLCITAAAHTQLLLLLFARPICGGTKPTERQLLRRRVSWRDGGDEETVHQHRAIPVHNITRLILPAPHIHTVHALHPFAWELWQCPRQRSAPVVSWADTRQGVAKGSCHQCTCDIPCQAKSNALPTACYQRLQCNQVPADATAPTPAACSRA